MHPNPEKLLYPGMIESTNFSMAGKRFPIILSVGCVQRKDGRRCWACQCTGRLLKDRSAVVAFSDELDGWISRMSDGENDEMLARVKNNVNRLAWHTSEVAVADTSAC